jgi:hypothetical protein
VATKQIPVPPTRAQRRLGMAFEKATRQMRSMNQATDMRPSNWHDAVRVEAVRGDIALTCSFGPVVMRVPERANHSKTELYVVVSGRMSLEASTAATANPLQILSFGTEVAYFRHASGSLTQVFGAHYDFDPSALAHPVFHAQLATNDDMARHAIELYDLKPSAVVPLSGNLLKNIRLPSAQLDFLTVITQICADHLIWKESPLDALRVFNELRNDCAVVHGIMPSPSPTGSDCTRGQHWYGPN